MSDPTAAEHASAAPDPASDAADGPIGDTEVESSPCVDQTQADGADPVAEAEAKAAEYLATAQRLQADFANFRKRAEGERAEAGDRAVSSLIEKLLPVLDTIDYARAHGASDGLEQVAAPLLELLVGHGLERIDPKGEGFDPNRHDAVMHEEGDGEPTVSEVLRAGWAFKGRVLRAAMVKVAG